jgi:hypothetical protein
MNLRNIPKEHHEALYLLDAEMSKQKLEVNPKYKDGVLTIVIYKRFLGIPFRIDLSAEIGDILRRIGKKIAKVLRIGQGKSLPCYVIDNMDAVVSDAEPEARRKAKEKP